GSPSALSDMAAKKLVATLKSRGGLSTTGVRAGLDARGARRSQDVGAGLVNTFFKEEEHVPEDSEQRRGLQRASPAAGHLERDVEVDGAALVGLPHQPRGR